MSCQNLPVGPYQLKVFLQGFNTCVQDGIVGRCSAAVGAPEHELFGEFFNSEILS